jgi:hypothetical protein
MDFLRAPDAEPPARARRINELDVEGENISPPTGKNLEENCGVFGVIGKANASRVVFFGLYALNHRESATMCT